APRWVLYRFSTIDERLPGMEDALAQQALLSLYRPVLEEREFLLLERREDRTAPVAAARPIVLERAFHLGEEGLIPALEGRAHVLEIDLGATPLGALRTFFYRAPCVWMEITRADGVSDRYRVVPEMLSAGVLAHPLLIGNEEWADWYRGRETAGI